MATVDQSEFSRFGAGDRGNVFVRVDKRVDLTLATTTPGGMVQASFQVPAGAQRLSVSAETPVAFSGSPTAVNLQVGTAAGGAQIVAGTDVKAQGRVTATVVAGFDNTAPAAAGPLTVWLQVQASGGTTPAGTCVVYVGYAVSSE